MMHFSKKSAFSLIELSIVIIVIGILISGVIQGRSLIMKAAVDSARSLTESSPVASLNSLSLWLESTSDKSFLTSESEDGELVSIWKDIKPNTPFKAQAVQSDNTYKPKYVSNAINFLPAIELQTDTTHMDINNFLPAGSSLTIANSFSIFVVAQTTITRNTFSLPESTSGMSCISHQSMLLRGSHGDTHYPGQDAAGASISFGTNGVSFCEHSSSYLPVLMIHDDDYLKPTVILMEYNDKSPSLYINGTFKHTGLTSLKTYVYPPVTIGGPSLDRENTMLGYVGEIIVFDEVLKSADRDAVNDYLKQKWGISE